MLFRTISCSLLLLVMGAPAWAQSQKVDGNCNIVVGSVAGDLTISSPLCEYFQTGKSEVKLSAPIAADSTDANPMVGRWCASGGRLADFSSQTEIRPVAGSVFRIASKSTFEEYMLRYGDVVLDDPSPNFVEASLDENTGDFYLTNENGRIIEVISVSRDGFSSIFYNPKSTVGKDVGYSYHRCGKCFVEQMILFCEDTSQFKRYYTVPNPLSLEALAPSEIDAEVVGAFCAETGTVGSSRSFVAVICANEETRDLLRTNARAARVLQRSFTLGPSDIVQKSPSPVLWALAGSEEYQTITAILDETVAFSDRLSDQLLRRGSISASQDLQRHSLVIRWAHGLSHRIALSDGDLFTSGRDVVRQKVSLLAAADKTLELTLDLRSDGKVTASSEIESAVGFYFYSIALASNGSVGEAREAIEFSAAILNTAIVASSDSLSQETAELIFFLERQFQ